MRQWKIIWVIGLCILSGMLSGQAKAQTRPIESSPKFQYDVINQQADNSSLSRFHIVTSIAYDNLQFKQTPEGYVAVYEVAVIVNDRDGEQIGGKAVQQRVAVAVYNETNAHAITASINMDIDVDPGKYELVIRLTDMDTRKGIFFKEKVVARDFLAELLDVSDVVVVNSIEIDSSGRSTMVPLAAQDLQENQRVLYPIFTIYSRDEAVSSFEIEYQVKPHKKRKTVVKDQITISKTGSATLCKFPIEFLNIPVGQYLLHIKIKDGSRFLKVKENFTLRWKDLPDTIDDLEQAIEQIRYIAGGKELKKMQRAEASEKANLFLKFWEKRDPSPGTPQNEYMIEYFNRVAYANRAFSAMHAGWRSDMGMVFILFGSPDDIDRHPFETDSKPYEIWFYHGVERQFVFLDENGFGDYRLTMNSLAELHRDIRWRP